MPPGKLLPRQYPAVLRLRVAGWQNQRRISQMARQVTSHAHPTSGQAPVIFFNVSTRLTGLSQNAAFSLLTSWGLSLGGVPVKHFVCNSGMSHCVLGINREDYTQPPPCKTCLAQTHRLFLNDQAKADVYWFKFERDLALASLLEDLSVDKLSNFEYENSLSEATLFPGGAPIIPLGRLVLPSIRWTLRRHSLPDDEPTRYLLREFISSAFSLAQEFTRFIDQTAVFCHSMPAAAVIFNGVMYPEATARWVAKQLDLRVITHEVGFQRFSAFFSDGDATAYPIHIPDSFELTTEQNSRLDAYLEKRFQGQFTMAGIRFWPEMRGLDQAFLELAAQFRQIVPVFTNVVYDTSQVHANMVFSQMFAWLDLVLEIIQAHPETLFVIRAHPDEMRPGTAKQSRESVRAWVTDQGVDRLPNVVFIDSGEYISSYELIQRAKFVIVYNSSIGMEAALMGAAVLCGGKARYTQYPIVFFPTTPKAYREQAEEFLTASTIKPPPEFQRNARRFLYYQLFRASLSFEQYLQTGARQGFVQLKSFTWRDLLPENSPTIRTLQDGILKGAPFLIDE